MQGCSSIKETRHERCRCTAERWTRRAELIQVVLAETLRVSKIESKDNAIQNRDSNLSSSAWIESPNLSIQSASFFETMKDDSQQRITSFPCRTPPAHRSTQPLAELAYPHARQSHLRSVFASCASALNSHPCLIDLLPPGGD
jgi:hypothetical protein